MSSHRHDREIPKGDRLLWICCGNLLWEDQLPGHNRLFLERRRTHSGTPYNGNPQEISRGVFRVSLDCPRVLSLTRPSLSVTESSLPPAPPPPAHARTRDLEKSLAEPYMLRSRHVVTDALFLSY